MEKFERRDIILMAGGTVAGAAAGTLFSGAPFQMLQWLVEWTQDQHVPGSGDERYVDGVCRACGEGCKISVRMIGNRAVKVETADSGCARAQAAIQLLYHPERIRGPLKRTGRKGSARFEPVSWDQAIKDIAGKIDSLRKAGKGDSMAAVDSMRRGISGLLLERLLKACGSPHFYGEPSLDGLSAAAVALTQYQAGSLHYDFENADYILSFGARLVEGWGDAARMNRAFSGWKARGARYVHVDTLCTRSAAVADSWIPVRAGSEAVLALGIANSLLRMGRGSGAGNFAQFSQIVINDFTPERVAELTGVSIEDQKKIAREFASARNPVAVAGRGAVGVSSSTVEIAAVMALNSMVGSLGRKGGVMLAVMRGLGEPAMDASAAQSYRKAARSAGLDAFIKNKDIPEVLFVNEGNPVHRSALGMKLAGKLEKIPMVVAFASLINDTAAYADYILPTVSTLETGPREGAEPVSGRYEAMHAGDALLKIAKSLAGIQASFPWNSYRDIPPAAGEMEARAPGNFTLPVDLLKTYLADVSKRLSPSKDYPLALVPFELYMVGDGDGLALPYVLKGIDGQTLTGKKLWVSMNPETADTHGVSEGERIDIESRRGEIGSVKVHLSGTVAPGVIAVPLGFGHECYTEYASGKGVNPKEIMNNKIDRVSGAADWWFTRVKIS